jgi:DNA-directed RNA polymerase specialized sigma24 family protein
VTAELLAEEFEAYRPHLRTVAHRVLGSMADADDAVQDAWLRAQGLVFEPGLSRPPSEAGWRRCPPR